MSFHACGPFEGCFNSWYGGNDGREFDRDAPGFGGRSVRKDRIAGVFVLGLRSWCCRSSMNFDGPRSFDNRTIRNRRVTRPRRLEHGMHEITVHGFQQAAV